MSPSAKMSLHNGCQLPEPEFGGNRRSGAGPLRPGKLPVLRKSRYVFQSAGLISTLHQIVNSSYVAQLFSIWGTVRLEWSCPIVAP